MKFTVSGKDQPQTQRAELWVFRTITTWVRTSPAPGTWSLCIATLSAEEFCPSLAASLAGVWSSQGAMEGSPAVPGQPTVGPGLGNGMVLSDEQC